MYEHPVRVSYVCTLVCMVDVCVCIGNSVAMRRCRSRRVSLKLT